MKKIRDPKSGAIKYVPDINDASKYKLINRIAELERKVKKLEILISQLNSEGNN
jgi:hypothetical protein